MKIWFSNKRSWFLIPSLMIWASILLCGCSHRATTYVERSADTLVIHCTDTMRVYDTVVVMRNELAHDSVCETTMTYVVVDSLGQVRNTYVTHSKETFHNRNALSADHHSSVQERSKVNELSRNTNKATSNVIETSAQATVRTRLKAHLNALVFVAFIAVLVYLYIYHKKK